MTEPLFEDGRPRMGAAGPVRVRVPAKVNLHLAVGPVRPDGYHELTTVYHAIAVYDEVTARRGDQLTLTMEGEGAGILPLDGDNLVLRAARELADATGVPARARLHLRKQIPVAGGLAGGSADAAAALVACDALWGTGLSRDELARAVLALRDRGRIDPRVAAAALIELAAPKLQRLVSSAVVQAAGVVLGEVATPSGLLIAG